jgi:hypothetical protein
MDIVVENGTSIRAGAAVDAKPIAGADARSDAPASPTIAFPIPACGSRTLTRPGSPRWRSCTAHEALAESRAAARLVNEPQLATDPNPQWHQS